MEFQVHLFYKYLFNSIDKAWYILPYVYIQWVCRFLADQNLATQRRTNFSLDIKQLHTEFIFAAATEIFNSLCTTLLQEKWEKTVRGNETKPPEMSMLLLET